EYGNLASRTLAMVHRYRDGVVPDAETDPELRAAFEDLPATVATAFDGLRLTDALESIWELVRRCNRYVEERAPWKLAKEPADAAALDQVLASLAEGLRVLTVLLTPYMPASTATLLDALGAPAASFQAARFGPRGGGRTVAALAPLFPKR
ncbi:MAG: class I tRNA ligase family protein, partial [Solirubrobacteraceae bacterium]